MKDTDFLKLLKDHGLLKSSDKEESQRLTDAVGVPMTSQIGKVTLEVTRGSC